MTSTRRYCAHRPHGTTTTDRSRRHRRFPLATAAAGLLLITVLAAGAAAPELAAATHPAAGPGGTGPVVLALAESVDEVLTNVRNWLMGILAALATVFATVGGVRYVMAGGEPGEVEKAKSALRSAAFGYALAALAPLVVTVLRGLVGA